MKYPPCAKWGVWTGKEIEGEDQLGCHTLFLRYTNGHTLENVLRVAEYYLQGPYFRVWVCKEHISGNLGCYASNVAAFVRTVQAKWKAVVAFEVSTPEEYSCVSEARDQMITDREITADRMVIFVKIPWVTDSKPDDYICVGPAFKDTAVKIAGTQVHPEQYANDVCLDGMLHLH